MNICMLNLKLNVFISIVKNILFVKSNKNYHLQAFFFIMYTLTLIIYIRGPYFVTSPWASKISGPALYLTRRRASNIHY